MPSPFPGMDPFLEIAGDWRDFHSAFISYARQALNEHLPEDYVARIDERFYLAELPDEDRHFLPDVAITRGGPIAPRPALWGGLSRVEPVVLPQEHVALAEVRERWVEIRRRPDWDLVTAIELLSPTYKVGSGRGAYLEKRLDLLRRPVHMVEIDLLAGGQRLPMKVPLPAGDFYTFVTRSERRWECAVYSWTVRQQLPMIPIPLKAPDSDIPLDLAAVLATAYREGRYHRTIDYTAAVSLPLAPDDRTWAEGLAKGSARPR